MIKIKYPKKKSDKEIIKFFKKKNLNIVNLMSTKKVFSVNDMSPKEPYQPDLNDLYRLYQFVVLNKRTTILEFGSGWSSLIFYEALNELKKKYIKQLTKLRRNNPFELFILDNEKKYLEISKKRIVKFSNKNIKLNKTKVHFLYSKVEMVDFNGMITSQYKKIHNCNPDFIYLDGPDQFNVKKNINGISTNHKDMMPMSADILKFEFFLTPGTIIVVDGRSANAQFLRDNFKRKWEYKYDKINDQHIFLLKADLLGKYNKLQIQFYNKK
jgi:hypothetical protein